MGVKYDGGKVRLDLLPPNAVIELGKVLTMGAAKYGDNNWQGVSKVRYIAAALRHLMARMQGHRFDEESGLLHTAHALCCLAFIVHKEVEDAKVQGISLDPSRAYTRTETTEHQEVGDNSDHPRTIGS